MVPATDEAAQGAAPRFTRDELLVVLGTSGAYALRMFGLYMALPVMSTWAAGLPGSTTFGAGLALGGYGLTQAILQVPALRNPPLLSPAGSYEAASEQRPPRS